MDRYLTEKYLLLLEYGNANYIQWTPNAVAAVAYDVFGWHLTTEEVIKLSNALP